MPHISISRGEALKSRLLRLVCALAGSGYMVD